MTLKTDTYNYTQNPLAGGNYTTITASGLQSTTGGADGSSLVTQDNCSGWSTTNATFAPTQSSEITFGSTPTNNDWAGAGVLLSTTGGGQGYIVYYIPESGVIAVFPLTSGTVGSGTTNNIGAAAITFASGDKLKITWSTGGIITVYKNSTPIVTSPSTITSSTYTTGQPGLAYQFGNSNGTKISAWTGSDTAAGPSGVSITQFFSLGTLAQVAPPPPFAVAVPWGPGVSPSDRTQFFQRPLSLQVKPPPAAVSTAQHFAYGQLTGVMSIIPVASYFLRGPGISPDYAMTFFRQPLSTTTIALTSINGVGCNTELQAYGNLGGLASSAARANTEHQSRGTLTGLAQMSGVTFAQMGAISAPLQTGAPVNITGVAFTQMGVSSGTLTGKGALTGTANIESQAYGALPATAALSGRTIAEAYLYGGALGTVTINGVALTQLSTVGAMTGTLAATGTMFAQNTGIGILAGSARLAGTIQVQMAPYGSLLGTATLQGRAAHQAFTYGLLLTPGAGLMHGVSFAEVLAYGVLGGTIRAFGYSNPRPISETGLPEANPCYVESSSNQVRIAYFDNTGLPFIPTRVRYRIDDTVSGQNIQPWLDINPSTTNVITVHSPQNAMISRSRQTERHQMLFEITDGYGDKYYVDTYWDVIRVVPAFTA